MWERRLFKGLYAAGICAIPLLEVENDVVALAVRTSRMNLAIEVDSEHASRPRTYREFKYTPKLRLLETEQARAWYRPIGLLGEDAFGPELDTPTRTPAQRAGLALQIPGPGHARALAPTTSGRSRTGRGPRPPAEGGSQRAMPLR